MIETGLEPGLTWVDPVDEAVALLHAHAPGVEWDWDDPDGVNRAYRTAVKAAHPDSGIGNPDLFRRLTAARDLLHRAAR